MIAVGRAMAENGEPDIQSSSEGPSSADCVRQAYHSVVHHIKWLTHGGSDDPSNMIVISPDLHAAIHANDGQLEWHAGLPVFVIGGRRMPLAVNRHLKPPGA